MNHDQIPQSVGWQLGTDGFQNIVENVGKYCACEERRITLTNGGSIHRSKAELSFLVEEEQRLADRLRNEPPAGDLRHLRRRAIYYWTVTAVLTVAGFALTILAFDPFRLGWKAWVYCLGIAIVTPFLVEKVLDHWNAEKLIKAMAAVRAPPVKAVPEGAYQLFEKVHHVEWSVFPGATGSVTACGPLANETTEIQQVTQNSRRTNRD